MRLVVYGASPTLFSYVLMMLGWLTPEIVFVTAVPSAFALVYAVLSVHGWFTRRDRIEIHAAKWGAPGRWYDVKGVLKNAIKERGVDVEVVTELFGDPHRGNPDKVLLVVYSVDGAAAIDRECREGSRWIVDLG